jgi:hypothetical protein
MAPLLLYLLPRPLSEVLLVEEVHHRAATTAVRQPQEEVSSLETEPLANNAFLTASGDEARECLSMLAQVVAVVVVNVNEVEAETDLTERRLETRYPSTPPPLASNLAHGICDLLDTGTKRSSSCHSTFYVNFSQRTVITHLENVHMYAELKLASTYRRSKRNLMSSVCP